MDAVRRGLMITLASVVLAGMRAGAATCPPGTVCVPCTGTPQANADLLCGGTSDPCTIDGKFLLTDDCQLDFGSRSVTVTNEIAVSRTPIKCGLGCIGGTRPGALCTTDAECQCSGMNCPSHCDPCGPPCPRCCQDSVADFCGGSIDITAGALQVACSGRIQAVPPTAGDVPADSDIGGGEVNVIVDRDLTVRGRIDASGRDYGGFVTLLPNGALTIDGHGSGCPGVVVADGTRDGSEAEADGAAGGTIVMGGTEDDDFPRAMSLSILGGGAVRARGGAFGDGGTISGDACGAVSIGSASEINARGGQSYSQVCDRSGGSIALSGDTLQIGGAARAGLGGCLCVAPAARTGTECGENRTCDSFPGAGDGICGGICFAPPPMAGQPCASNADCDSAANRGDGVCGGLESDVNLTGRMAAIAGTVDPFVACDLACGGECGTDGICIDPDLICCGNGRVDGSEQCDDGTDDLHGPCPACALSFCGDHFRNPATEACDDPDLGTATCTSLGFDGGTLGCKPTCSLDASGCFRCGNGVREASEECDGSDVGGASCQSLGFSGGALECFPLTSPLRCHFDTAPCSVCGNGEIEDGEVCDGADLNGGSCVTLGFPGGTLTCAAGCRSFDARQCFVCGNGRREGAEECDGPDLGGASCNAPGETGGEPSCTADCRLDRTTCFYCGNRHVDPGEECDDGNTALGDGCTPQCRTECGNGTVERNEECDDGNRTAGDGCSAECAREQPFGGGGNARDCALEWAVEGGEASRRQVCTDGDSSCDRETVAGQCAFQLFYCLNVTAIVVGGPAPCTPTDVSRIELRRPSLEGARALSPADADSLLGAIGETMTRAGATVSRAGAALQVAPSLRDRRLCGTATVHVPLRGTAAPYGPGRRIVSVQVTDSSGGVDRDSITLVCLP